MLTAFILHYNGQLNTHMNAHTPIEAQTVDLNTYTLSSDPFIIH